MDYCFPFCSNWCKLLKSTEMKGNWTEIKLTSLPFSLSPSLDFFDLPGTKYSVLPWKTVLFNSIKALMACSGNMYVTKAYPVIFLLFLSIGRSISTRLPYLQNKFSRSASVHVYERFRMNIRPVSDKSSSSSSSSFTWMENNN